MKYIDISTSHNISVRYELASVMHRILAWLIDITILMLYVGIVSIVAIASTFLWYVLVFFVVAFYHLIFEILNNGQSIGKRMMKIKVVTLNGRSAKSGDYFLRWIFRILEVTFTGGLLAILYITSTEKHQRIGDILAQTTVIKLKADNFYDLKGLVKLGDQKREITYQNVTMYNDTDLMLVKDTLARINKTPNDENRKFLRTLSDKMAVDLNVNLENVERVTFLETLLLDYITLTR
ncbi:MAG: putative RDD family membrane protein YckC [Saprospiraceae bacterium]